jgi:hypothetical protein
VNCIASALKEMALRAREKHQKLAVPIKERDVMQCPKCKLENLSGTTWCDCGYNFPTGEVSKKTSSEPREDFPAAVATEEYF